MGNFPGPYNDISNSQTGYGAPKKEVKKQTLQKGKLIEKEILLPRENPRIDHQENPHLETVEHINNKQNLAGLTFRRKGKERKIIWGITHMRDQR